MYPQWKVALVAYSIWQVRMKFDLPGDALSDWYEAERRLRL